MFPFPKITSSILIIIRQFIYIQNGQNGWKAWESDYVRPEQPQFHFHFIFPQYNFLTLNNGNVNFEHNCNPINNKFVIYSYFECVEQLGSVGE